MFWKLIVALGAAGALATGALAVMAGDAHGDAVRAAARASTSGEAHGDAVRLVASARGVAARTDAKADATAKASVSEADETETEAADNEAADNETAENDAEKPATTESDSENDAHGDAVSAAARSDGTAALKDADQKNHGAFVRAIARKQ